MEGEFFHTRGYYNYNLIISTIVWHNSLQYATVM